MRRSGTLVALALSAAALSACGSGLEAQTYKPRTAAAGTDASVGDVVQARNLGLNPFEQGDLKGLALTGAFVNSDDQDDALVNVTSDVAGSIRLDSAAGQDVLVVPARSSSGTQWAVVLTELTREVLPGQYVDLTLEFARAGRTTVSVPVRANEITLDERAQLQNPYGEGGGSEEGATEGTGGTEPAEGATPEPSAEGGEPAASATPSG